MGTAQVIRPTGRSAHRQWWAHARGPLIVLTALLAVGLLFALVRSGERQGRLDPRSSDRNGSRAVAELLKDRGVGVRAVTTTRDAAAGAQPDTTLLVTDPELLTDGQHQLLHTAYAASGARVVLLAPGDDSLAIWAPGVEPKSTSNVATRRPDCTLPAARRAGAADLGGIRYSASVPHTQGCYPSRGLPTLLRMRTATDGPDGDTVLLGAPDLLFNHRLDEQGNASLALQVLGSRTHLLWYLPSLDDPAADAGDESLVELIPAGWRWGALQLTLAAALAALWRARRLGPLITEPLPVSVSASETVEGHGRLYHRAGARPQAAFALRSAARTRLAGLTGVPHGHRDDPAVLPSAVLPRLASDVWSPDHVLHLLFGPAPRDDAELIRLADDLDALIEQIAPGPTPRHGTPPPSRDKDDTS
ncbi:DUF4350 domain-containing protein [Streptomyces sp. NPDC018031]|uniref:DUF4350 domain-containing protein n=1 Tax=Streptomyces sp. NPDC018031 TaxID=3365033 RepID=UPI0037947F60